MCKVLRTTHTLQQPYTLIDVIDRPQVCDIGPFHLKDIFTYLLKLDMAGLPLHQSKSPSDVRGSNNQTIWEHGGNNEWLSRVTPPRDLDESDSVDIGYADDTVAIEVVESLLSSSPSPPRDDIHAIQSFTPRFVCSPPSSHNSPEYSILDYPTDDHVIYTSSSKESVSAGDTDSGSCDTETLLYATSLENASGRLSKTPPPTPPPINDEYRLPPVPPGSSHRGRRQRARSLQETGSDDRLKFEFGKVLRRIDDVEVLSQMDQVKNIDWTKQKQRRGGVIVYFIHQDKIIFGLGSDSTYKEITDFGGGVEKIDTDPVDTALREFQEETLGVYGNINREDVSECMVIYNRTMMIMFLPLRFDPAQITENFNQRVQIQNNPEINELVWLTKNNFINIITDSSTPDLSKDDANDRPISPPSIATTSNGTFQLNNTNSRPMYERVGSFLRSAVENLGDFTQKL